MPFFFMKFTYIFSGLYRKGYVYIDVPIADDDCIIGNYVSNNGYRPSGINTVDSHYLEFDGTMEKIQVNRSSTQQELRKYRKCSLFNDERETTRAKF